MKEESSTTSEQVKSVIKLQDVKNAITSYVSQTDYNPETAQERVLKLVFDKIGKDVLSARFEKAKNEAREAYNKAEAEVIYKNLLQP